MAREIRSEGVVVTTSKPTFGKRVIDRWGVEGGDYTEYYIRAFGGNVSVRSGTKDLSGSTELLVKLAEGILEVVAAQNEYVY